MSTTNDNHLDASIIKPNPRQPFELTPESPTFPDSPASDISTFPSQLDASKGTMSGTTTPSRTRSVLNLTSSTLFGIYQPTGYAADREDATPWGTGAQTPAENARGSFDFTRARIPESVEVKPNGQYKRRKSTVTQKRALRKGFKGYVLPLVGRELALCVTGVLYGLLVSHLHDRQGIAPVKVDIDRSWVYLTVWGIVGVLLGEALPWVDSMWASEDDDDTEEKESDRRGRSARGWNDAVRSIGAFVGIAFAIRKLPWESTLQLSLTLALANPALWYLIDRSPPGFIISTFVAIVGTAALLAINPALVPPPSSALFSDAHGTNATTGSSSSKNLVLGIFSQESVGVWTWIASVLFVSSVCFGNVGRQLAPSRV